jgi:Bifunctional DNA primase/polymerase, N-terminal/Primase C terminal 1 (PriCT-1)
MGALLDTALTYAARGWCVFPCQPRAKEPGIAKWPKRATTDPNMIAGWWRNTEYNIGLQTGKRSGLWVLDIDGVAGEAELAKLEYEYGALPATTEIATGKGRHLWLLWPGRKIPNSAGKIAPGIDVRGDGGYVLAPPSIHPSGKAYEWNSTAAPAAAPDWLISRAIGAGFSARCDAPVPSPPSEWTAIFAGPIPEGRRDDTMARAAGYLLCRRVAAGVTLEILRSINAVHGEPPLPDGDLIRIVNSIAGKEMKRRPGFGH